MSTFAQLWKNYPSKDEMKKSCRNVQPDGGNEPFTDYCTIMLSECFNRSCVIYVAKGHCWSHSGQKHILLAENLAIGLKNHPPAKFGKIKKNQSYRFSIYS